MFSARISTQFFRQNIPGVRSLVQLRGRPFLPGSDSPTFPLHLAEFRDDFPRMIKAPSIEAKDLKSYGLDLWPTLKQHIEDHGCVGVRGLPIENEEDFNDFLSSFGLNNMEYVGGLGVRKKLAARVSTASDDSSAFTIEPHCEMSYLPYWPQLLTLCCRVPPAPGCGGETGITDVKEIYKELDKEVVEKFKKKGVRYHAYMPDKSKTTFRSWQQAMMTESRTEAEKRVQNPGQYFKWDDDGALSYWTNIPAMAPHYRTGEMLWFNQATTMHCTYYKSHPTVGPKLEGLPDTKYPHTTFYGDGSLIEPDYLQHIREVAWKNTVGAQLQKSDMVIFDNMRMQHTRLSFTGERKMMISLATFKEYS